MAAIAEYIGWLNFPLITEVGPRGSTFVTALAARFLGILTRRLLPTVLADVAATSLTGKQKPWDMESRPSTGARPP